MESRFTEAMHGFVTSILSTSTFWYAACHLAIFAHVWSPRSAHEARSNNAEPGFIVRRRIRTKELSLDPAWCEIVGVTPLCQIQVASSRSKLRSLKGVGEHTAIQLPQRTVALHFVALDLNQLVIQNAIIGYQTRSPIPGAFSFGLEKFVSAQ